MSYSRLLDIINETRKDESEFISYEEIALDFDSSDIDELEKEFSWL